MPKQEEFDIQRELDEFVQRGKKLDEFYDKYLSVTDWKEFRSTVFRLNPNSQTPFTNFSDALGPTPFRLFVEYRLHDLNAKELQDAALNHWQDASVYLQLPSVGWESVTRVSGTLKARWFTDQSYWQGQNPRTCNEALQEVIAAVKHEFAFEDAAELGTDADSNVKERGLLSLVWFFADLCAGLAAESRITRKFIGVRKGLFG